MTKKEIRTVNELLEKNKLGYAYLYPADGGDRKEYAFDMTPENIASFLGKNFTNAEKMILTDMADRLILDTFGGFINQCHLVRHNLNYFQWFFLTESHYFFESKT